MTQLKATPRKHTTVRLSDDLRKQIRARAAAENRTFTNMLETLLKQALETLEKREAA